MIPGTLCDLFWVPNLLRWVVLRRFCACKSTSLTLSMYKSYANAHMQDDCCTPKHEETCCGISNRARLPVCQPGSAGTNELRVYWTRCNVLWGLVHWTCSWPRVAQNDETPRSAPKSTKVVWLLSVDPWLQRLPQTITLQAILGPQLRVEVVEVLVPQLRCSELHDGMDFFLTTWCRIEDQAFMLVACSSWDIVRFSKSE